MQCQRAGCACEATQALKLNIPSFGDPEGMAPRTCILLNVVLCEEHVDQAEAADFLNAAPEVLGPLITVSMSGHPPADLERVWCSGVSVFSDEFKSLQAQTLLNSAKVN